MPRNLSSGVYDQVGFTASNNNVNCENFGHSMWCYIGSDNMDRARGGLHGNHNVLNIFFEILARIPRILLDPRMDEDVFELFLFFFAYSSIK